MLQFTYVLLIFEVVKCFGLVVAGLNVGDDELPLSFEPSFIRSDGILTDGTRLDEIQHEVSEEPAGISEDFEPHLYLLSVLGQMMSLGDKVGESGREPRVVAVLPQINNTVTDTYLTDVPGPEKGVTLTFDLRRSVSVGVSSVTAAQLILYMNTSCLDQPATEDLFLQLTICNANGSLCNTSQSWLQRNSSNAVEIFDVTKTYSDYVNKDQTELTVVMSVSYGPWDNATEVSPESVFITDDQQRGPLLFVYHNMAPFHPQTDDNKSAPYRFLMDDIDDIDDSASYNETKGGNSKLNETDNVNNKSPSRDRREASKQNDKHSKLCHVHPWSINFHKDLQWTWIKFPWTFDGNYCAGICPSPLRGKGINSTNNAFIRDQYHLITQWKHKVIPGASCVPNKLGPLDVYYVLKKDHVIQRLPDMTVLSCVCL